MARPYSMDLRERVVGAIEGGMSRREAAEVFGISPSTAVKWMRRHYDIGSVAARAMGGDLQSKRVPWLLQKGRIRFDLIGFCSSGEKAQGRAR